MAIWEDLDEGVVLALMMFGCLDEKRK